MNIACIATTHNLIGDCTLRRPEHRSLYCTEINGFKIQDYAIEYSALSVWKLDEPVSSLSLTTDPEHLFVALGSRLILWNPATDQRFALVEMIADKLR